MNKKISLQKIVLFSSCGIILLIALSLIILAIASRKPVAAFYGIPERNQKQIETILQTTHTRRNKKSLPYEIVTLDSSVSLQKALKTSKKPTLLFINNGMNADYAAKLSIKSGSGFESSILSPMTRSVKQTAIVQKDKVFAVPLLLDNYEIDISNVKFQPEAIENVFTLDDMEKLAKMSKSSTRAPIIFAAAEDEILLDIFGAFVESIEGKEKYESAVKKIQQSISVGKSSRVAFANLLTEMCAPDGEFYETVQLFKKWEQTGILQKNYLQFQNKDVTAYMATEELSAIVIMSLTKHRSTDRNVITKFTSSFIPSANMGDKRNFTIPVTYGILLKKDKIAKKSIEMLAGDLQQHLCNKTGLAPVLSTCGVPDHQSDDVRYWVAATDKPLAPLSNAAFTNKPNRTAFAEALRSQLR